jgi:hypothetical protein
MTKIFILLVFLVVVSGVVFINQNEYRPQNTEEYEIGTEERETGQNTTDDTVEEPEKDRILDLSGRNLSRAPDYIFNLTNLQTLDLSNNNLEGALQAEIRYLQELQVLNLSNNNFTGVPAEIGQLKKLQELNLSNNQLTGLPYELGNLSNLKVLDLSGNSYSQQDLNSIKNSLPDTVVIKTD